MKWILMFLTLAMRQLNTRLRGPSLRQTLMDIFNEAREKSKKLANLIIGGIAATVFFCGGFFIALLNISGQWDALGEVGWTATLISGLALMAASLLAVWALYSSFTKSERVELRDRQRQRRRSARSRYAYSCASSRSETGSSLESALAALVMDYVHERQTKRENQQNSFYSDEPGPFSQGQGHSSRVH